jgi:hypothetical protein
MHQSVSLRAAALTLAAVALLTASEAGAQQSVAISQLPAASPLSGPEIVPMTQSAATVRATVGAIATFTLNSMTAAQVVAALTYTPLNPANNLQDLTSPPAARTNLGLGYFATGTLASQLTGTLNAGQLPAFSGDVTSSAGSTALTVIKTNGVPFGTAATANTGTSGATVPLLNAANAWSGAQTFGAGEATTAIAGTAAVTLTAGASGQVGSGATLVCAASHVCDQVSGELTLTTGTGALAAGTVATVTFPAARTNIPNCVETIEGGTTFLAPQRTETTTSLAVAVGAAMAPSTAYTLTYVCGGA